LQEETIGESAQAIARDNHSNQSRQNQKNQNNNRSTYFEKETNLKNRSGMTVVNHLPT
jgi:hypothetical protein